MPLDKIDSLDNDLKPMVLRIVAQNASLMQRLDDLLAQNKALIAQHQAALARIAELEAKLGTPPKTPDNSSLPPSRGQKANVAAGPKQRRKGRPGVARVLAENPDVTRNLFAERCPCGKRLGQSGQQIARAYDHIDLPPIKPVTTRINLFRTDCPCCHKPVTAPTPTDMPEGTPFGPGIAATVAYLHGCQLMSYKRLTEALYGLFGVTISQGAIANMLARVGKPFAAHADTIAATVRASVVIASDETSARVKGKTWWYGLPWKMRATQPGENGKSPERAFSMGTRCGHSVAPRPSIM